MSKKPKTSPSVSSSRKVKPSQKAQQQNQKVLWIGLGFAAVLAIIVGVLLLKPKSSQANNISVSEAYQKYQEGALFLDVRTEAEWDESHIEGSTLIPLNDLKNRLGELPLDRDIVVVCRSGNRSKQAVNTLQKAGFSRAVSMSGGVIAWDKAGYPLETGNP